MTLSADTHDPKPYCLITSQTSGKQELVGHISFQFYRSSTGHVIVPLHYALSIQILLLTTVQRAGIGWRSPAFATCCTQNIKKFISDGEFMILAPKYG